MKILYELNKNNYIKLLGGAFQEEDLLNIINDRYIYARGLNENNEHREINANGKVYSTIYGEVFTKDVNGKNSINILRNIAKAIKADFFGDIGSGHGMLPAAMSGIADTFGVEILKTRHDRAIHFMENEVNNNNTWDVRKICSPDTLGYAVLSKDDTDPKLYKNRVIFKHNHSGKTIEYLNGDMFYVKWKELLDGYKKPMFWISNLCFPELTNDLFVLFKDVLPAGTIIVLSRPPKNLEACNFRKVNDPSLDILNGELALPQTWADNHTVTVVEKIK